MQRKKLRVLFLIKDVEFMLWLEMLMEILLFRNYWSLASQSKKWKFVILSLKINRNMMN
jgi:hypothetical protein